MKKLITLVAFAAIACKKNPGNSTNANEVTVSATVQQESVTTGSGVSVYWAPVVNQNKAIPDSSFVVVQWDHHNMQNVFQATLKDTVKIGVSHCCATSHRTNYTTGGGSAKNVKVIQAWSKSGQYTFQF